MDGWLYHLVDLLGFMRGATPDRNSIKRALLEAVCQCESLQLWHRAPYFVP